MKLRKSALWLTGLVLLLAGSALATTNASKDVTSLLIQEENVKCINCHLKENNSLVQQWKNSPHAAAQDGQIGCFNCHAAEEDDPLGYMHEGAWMKTVQTPKDCGYCHEQEMKDAAVSRHATAGLITSSLENVLGEIVCSMEDKAGAANGGWACHGSVVKIMTDSAGKSLLNENQAVMLDPMTYPNSGVGRVNPDGTLGACTACHGRHSFRASVARQPENCGKCHMGPDHPQLEAYQESKHGIAYDPALRDRSMNGMNILKAGKWVLGKDYYSAPTCATCHMGSTLKSDGSVTASTHDVGTRISWNLKGPISKKVNRATFVSGSQADYRFPESLFRGRIILASDAKDNHVVRHAKLQLNANLPAQGAVDFITNHSRSGIDLEAVVVQRGASAPDKGQLLNYQNLIARLS